MDLYTWLQELWIQSIYTDCTGCLMLEEEANEDKESCYICMEICETFSPCQCQIRVHAECLKHLLLISGNNKCTICKTNLVAPDTQRSVRPSTTPIGFIVASVVVFASYCTIGILAQCMFNSMGMTDSQTIEPFWSEKHLVCTLLALFSISPFVLTYLLKVSLRNEQVQRMALQSIRVRNSETHRVPESVSETLDDGMISISMEWGHRTQNVWTVQYKGVYKCQKMNRLLILFMLALRANSACTVSHDELWDCMLGDRCLNVYQLHSLATKHPGNYLQRPYILALEGPKYKRLYNDCDINKDGCIDKTDIQQSDDKCQRSCMWRKTMKRMMCSR